MNSSFSHFINLCNDVSYVSNDISNDISHDIFCHSSSSHSSSSRSSPFNILRILSKISLHKNQIFVKRLPNDNSKILLLRSQRNVVHMCTLPPLVPQRIRQLTPITSPSCPPNWACFATQNDSLHHSLGEIQERFASFENKVFRLPRQIPRSRFKR
jgi:hypothetical protein